MNASIDNYNITLNAIMTQYRQEVEKGIKFRVHRERKRNLAKMQTMKFELKKCKKDLAKEKRRSSKLLEENEELRLTQGIDVER